MVRLTLKAARVNVGLTQAEAAKLLDISNKTLCNWEKGYGFPTPVHIDPLCELYGVTYDDLIFRSSVRLKRI